MRRKSKSDYPVNWKEIATRIKDAAGWKCVRCGREHDPKHGYCLTVHHLDIDPSNNAWYNAIPLCQRCHLSIQGRVIMERPFMFDHSEWFRPYVAGYYAHTNHLPEDKDYVLNNMEMLLSYGKPNA